MSRSEITKNILSQTLWLSTIVIASLLLLSLLPEISIGSFHIKKIDILSDLHPEPPVEIIIKSDTVIVEQRVSTDYAVTNTSITRIEDFSGEGKVLRYFINALKSSDSRQVRVAFFGDSFIEGDIISASFRDTLQQVFGGNGVGIVPLATEVSGFRKSIKHTYSNWDAYSLLTTQENGIPLGISGYSYVPRNGNRVMYKPGKIPRQKDFRVANIFYQNKGSASLTYQINEEPEMSQLFEKSDSVKRIVITHDGMKSIQFRIAPEDSVVLFGTSFENSEGIYVDNFSMRRNSGIALTKLSPTILKQFNDYLDYKLIILQYGLNVASENDSTNYTWYTSKMIKVISDLKDVFPKTSFLLLSVSDRGANKDGKIVTMNSIPKMRDMQREIARRSGIAFWDMFEAMGGKNSIPEYTEAIPPLASKDYTHLTHLGGNKIGRKLADALLHEFNKHENKNNIP